VYIYADVVLFVNFIMNSVILALTAYAAGIRFCWKRLLTAAFIGGVYALVGIFPGMAVLYTVPGKLLASVALILLAFGLKPFTITILLVSIFFIVSFILGGAVLGWLLFIQTGMLYSDAHSISVSWGNLIVGSIIAVALILLIVRRMLGRVYRQRALYQARIEYEGRCIEVTGLLDTGNGLYSLLGSKPVVLLNRQAALNLLSPQAATFLTEIEADCWLAALDQCVDTEWLARVEIIPYQSVGRQGMILGFRPDSVTVITECGEAGSGNVLIGIYEGVFAGDRDCQALLHPALITTVNLTKEAKVCALPGR